MARDRVQADYVVFPPGPADAEALGRVHVTAWRQTYPGLLPPANLARMSPERHARRFALSLSNAQASNVTLAPAGNMSARRFYERRDGVAEPERREPGPGGGAVFGVAYRWPDIASLTEG